LEPLTLGGGGIPAGANCNMAAHSSAIRPTLNQHCRHSTPITFDSTIMSLFGITMLSD
jgi:hypothetical protein